VDIITGKILDEKQILQLLKLQQENLKKNISKSEMEDQGFVTVEHNFEKLNTMNQAQAQIIATIGDDLVGYALSMPTSFKNVIPELTPMCELLDSLTFKSKKLSEYKYYIMGQICIAKNARGLGIFQKLYLQHAIEFSKDYDFIVTEVSINNKRSMRAHSKVGFETIHEYFDPENNDTWAVVLWDFKSLEVLETGI
jgi:predicted GNAT family N-acyltransferase